MSSKRIGPEAKIIALFTALPEESKRIVADVIKSQTTAPRKASKPHEPRKPKDAQPSSAVKAQGKETPGNGSLE